jgi:phosphomannomutase/phosphoglucomutase
MDSVIFREYDIRGLVDEEISDEDVRLIGKGVGSFLRRQNHKDVVVGRDCRLSSDQYSSLLTEGLVSTGCDVVDIGVCPTPVLYFAVRHLNKEGGVMVTASHNPPAYNGFKLCSGYDTLYGGQIQEVRQIIEGRTFEVGKGRIELADAVSPYRAFVENNIRLTRPLKVGLDAGNGTAGVVAVPIIKALGCQVHHLYCAMDGNFPNHEADPTVLENMKDLISLVREKKLDVGFGYDGDGDRLGVVDEKGDIVWGDQLMIIFAREILERKPGATFISEVKCSQAMYAEIERLGGRAVMWKTGHSLIKQRMKELKAEFAGEMSGHLFFADRYFGYDDAIYASCRLLEIMAATGKTVSQLLKGVPKTYTTPEIRIPCPEEKKFEVVKEVTEYFRQRRQIIDIDGVRVLFGDGWGLVRASNTQPVLVLRFEALSPERLSEIRLEVESVLNDVAGKG